MALIWKKGLFLTYFSQFFSHQGKDIKIPSTHIPHDKYMYFVQPIDIFAFPILQKLQFIM